MVEENQAGWAQVFTGKMGLATVILGLGVALPAINVYIVVTILPSLVRDIGGDAYYAWAATVFVAASLLGAVLGAFIIISFRYELIALGAPTSWYITFVGAVLIVAVIFNQMLARFVGHNV